MKGSISIILGIRKHLITINLKHFFRNIPFSNRGLFAPSKDFPRLPGSDDDDDDDNNAMMMMMIMMMMMVMMLVMLVMMMVMVMVWMIVMVMMTFIASGQLKPKPGGRKSGQGRH